jgi:uncharacterized membrane protein
LNEETRIKTISPVPADLILIVIWLAASIAVIYLPFFNAGLIRFFLALPVVLFIPGYCIIAVIYPKKRDIDLIERVALSFGLSIAVVPLIGFGLNFTPWGIRLDPIMLALTLLTIVMIAAAFYRRNLIPVTERFNLSLSEIAVAVKKQLIPAGMKREDRFLHYILFLVILIAIVTTLFIFMVPKEGEPYTEFYILGQNKTAADYPDQIMPGEDYSMYVGVGNHENADLHYTVETWLLLTEFDSVTNSSRILTMDPSDRISFALAQNETTIFPYNFSVKKSGYNRMEFLLFKENISDPELTGSDRISASYRQLHLWITVQQAK